ncbi:MAG: methanogenesis marker 6 protein [Methanosarcinales archaeon]
MTEEITKILVVSSDYYMPVDIAMEIYKLNTNAKIKETCFGVMITGTKEEVDDIINKVRQATNPNEIFVKERGFMPGDLRRCRADRGGGARPGYHFLEREMKMLPNISKALTDISPVEQEEKKKIKIDELKHIIEAELS